MGKNNEVHYNASHSRYTHSRRQGDDAIFDIRIWGVDEVCHFTQYAKGTVYNLVSRGEIPFRKRGGGRRLVFIPSEVIQWFTGEL
jgi:excisionase family DNA binding protein